MCVAKAIRGECQSLINHFEDNPEDVTLMVGQKDSSKAVSTEALMTVFHPQDVENLDPKMVNTEWNTRRFRIRLGNVVVKSQYRAFWECLSLKCVVLFHAQA